MVFKQFELKNGIRILHCDDKLAKVAHCCLMINVGSRDEVKGEEGLTHFIEHNLFKGTKKRKTYHILNGLESVGGELNAYTSKEQLCLYASFQNNYFDRAVNLIFDIALNSCFPDKEIKKEKEVVIDEINSYLDSPSEQIFDDFEELVFQNDPLGKNILGTEESILQFKKEDLVNYADRHFQPERMVFCSIGNIRFKRVIRILEENTTNFFRGKFSLPKRKFEGVIGEGQKKVEKKSSFQSHVIIGRACYGSNNPNRIGMILLNNILGGQALNSRLNLNVREKYGITYNLESNYSYFSDIGLFSIYFGTDKKNVSKTKKLIFKELNKLKNKQLGSLQLLSAKKQLIGQIALASESRLNAVLSNAKQLLLFDRIFSLDEVFDLINEVDALKLISIANEVFDLDRMQELVYE